MSPIVKEVVSGEGRILDAFYLLSKVLIGHMNIAPFLGGVFGLSKDFRKRQILARDSLPALQETGAF